MLLPASRDAIALPFARDARLGYRRLRRPTPLPEMTPRDGIAGWLHTLAQRIVAR